MGFVSDVVGGVASTVFPGAGIVGGFIDDKLLGGRQADAARDAARLQAESAERAIEFQREALAELREDLGPFREAGGEALDPLTALVTDPSRRAQFIQEDPAIKAILGQTFDRINANQAARGKLGSGGTLEALQTSALTLAPELINQRISQLQNLATLGSNAAARTGNAALQTGSNIGNLTTQRGDALAAGQVGAGNARAAGIQNILDLGFKAAGVSF